MTMSLDDGLWCCILRLLRLLRLLYPLTLYTLEDPADAIGVVFTKPTTRDDLHNCRRALLKYHYFGIDCSFDSVHSALSVKKVCSHVVLFATKWSRFLLACAYLYILLVLVRCQLFYILPIPNKKSRYFFISL